MIEVAPAADHMTAAQTAAGRPRGRWGNRLATATALYHLAQQGRQQWRNYQGNRAYSVTVHEGDEVYDLVQSWLLELLPDHDQHALTATTRTYRGDKAVWLDGSDMPVSDDRAEPVERRVVLAYDGARSHTVDLDGHAIAVVIQQDDTGTEPGRTPEGRTSYLYKPHKIVFSAPDVAGRRAIVAFLQGIADTLVSGKRVPRVVMASRWGHWGARRALPVRPLDTVVLPAGKLDDILADFRRFLDSEQQYVLMGQPWHRGYLLHGPPGTGKTSTFRAIAGALGIDVYMVSLSDLEADATLTQLVGDVPERAMLLLEDVDVVHAASSRDDAERPGITLAGLLNALDGMGTPHGLITAMTTNADPDALDPALLRPGRMDFPLELSYLEPEQFGRLVEQLTGHPCRLWHEFDADLGAGVPWEQLHLTAAEVVGVVMSHLDDLGAAVKECLLLLDRRGDAAMAAMVADARTAVTSDHA